VYKRQAGCEVTFIEQPDHYSDEQSATIKIHKIDGECLSPKVKIDVDVVNALKRNHFDLALIAVKAFDTHHLIENLAPAEQYCPPILCLQNGVENEADIESGIPKVEVIGASITTAVRRLGLGEVQVEKLRGIAIENTSTFTQSIIDLFNRAGLRAKGYPDRMSMKWSKLLTNLQVNATSAILNWSPSQVLKDPITYQIEVNQLKEALAVMKKMGVPVVDLPGTPVRLLIQALVNIPVSFGKTIVGLPLSKARGGKMPSLQIDLEAGRPLSEVEFLNGAVVRFGEKHNVPTPVNRALTNILVNLANGKLDKKEFINNPTCLTKRIEENS
jgi:2-dehydropantoate 2-reductase